MIKKIDNYQHVIYECKTDEEVMKSQDIVFKGGWRWGTGVTTDYHGTTLSNVRCIILQKNKKLQKSSDMSSKQVVHFYNHTSCLVVKSLSELNMLINGFINYNEKRVLLYD